MSSLRPSFREQINRVRLRMLAVVAVVLALVGAGVAIAAFGEQRPANPGTAGSLRAGSAHSALRSARCRWWPAASDISYLGPIRSTRPETEAELSVCP